MDRALIQQIKENFDYSEYLDAQGIDTKETNRDDEVRICCPSCGETDYKCYVNDTKKTFCCFKCGFGHRHSGDLFDFVAAVEGLPAGVAFHRICADYCATTPERLGFPDEDEEKPLPGFLDIKTIDELPCGSMLMEEDDEDAEPYFEYLKERGLTMAEILGMRTCYTLPFSYVKNAKGKKVKLSDRVLWPVYGGRGELVSWVSRTILPDSGQKSHKYINAPDTELAKTFWPYSPLPRTNKVAVLCEGILDALAIRRAGYLSFACFGKRLSREQVMLLEHWGAERIILFFDRDAKREMLTTVDVLRMRFKEVRVVDVSHWPCGQDSGDLLAHPDGADILQWSLERSIDVNKELAFLRWRTR